MGLYLPELPDILEMAIGLSLWFDWLVVCGLMTREWTGWMVDGVDGGRVDGGWMDGGRVDGGRVDGGRVNGGRVDGGLVDGGRGGGV